MSRYGVAISARNPARADSKIHWVAVDEDFGSSQRPLIGTIIPPEAHARTSCGMFATGFVVCRRDYESEEGWKRDCRMCP